MSKYLPFIFLYFFCINSNNNALGTKFFSTFFNQVFIINCSCIYSPPELRDNSPAGQEPTVTLPADGLDLPLYIADVERQLIGQALDETGGNRQQAARRLGLKRTTLVEKVRRLQPGQEKRQLPPK